MLYADNDCKFVVLVNKKIPLPRLMNAVCHTTLGLVSQCPDLNLMDFRTYTDADGGLHPAISRYPVIILSAKNGNQIRTLREAARAAGILYNDFADTMLGPSCHDQLEKTARTKEADLDYLVLCLFGSADALNPLTKKFSLFNGASADGQTENPATS